MVLPNLFDRGQGTSLPIILQALSRLAARSMHGAAGHAARVLGRAVLCSALFMVLGTSMPLETDDRAARGSAARGPGAAEVLRLDVLTWNVQLRPFVPEGKRWRTPLMAEHLRGYDIVLLQEAFSDAHRKLLLYRLADEYPYRTRVLGRDVWFSEDGASSS